MANFSYINKLALGTVQFGLDYGISNQQGQTSLIEIEQILQVCQKNGINTLDTAMAYGNAQQNLGKFNLANFKVISKFILDNKNINTKSIEILLKQTVTTLNVSSIYGYLYHRPLEVNKDNWQQLQALKNHQLINKIGFSLNTLDEANFILDNDFIPDLIQIPFNVFDNRFQEIATELKNKHDTEIHTRSTFLQGLFFVQADKLDKYFTPIKPILINLQETYQNDLPVYLMEYVLKQSFVDKMVLGINNQMQLNNNIQSLLEFSAKNSLQHISIEDKYRVPSLWENK